MVNQEWFLGRLARESRVESANVVRERIESDRFRERDPMQDVFDGWNRGNPHLGFLASHVNYWQ